MGFQIVLKRKENTRRVIIGTLLALSLSIPACSDDYYGLPTAEPESLGMSTEKLGAIKANLQPLIDEHKVPGFVTVVARNGKRWSRETEKLFILKLLAAWMSSARKPCGPTRFSGWPR